MVRGMVGKRAISQILVITNAKPQPQQSCPQYFPFHFLQFVPYASAVWDGEFLQPM